MGCCSLYESVEELCHGGNMVVLFVCLVLKSKVVPTVARNVYLLVHNRCITNAIVLLGHRNFVSSQQKMKYRI